MHLEAFWPDSFEKKSKTWQENRQKGFAHQDSDSESSLSQHGHNEEAALDPALSRALQSVTERICKVIDDKLGPVAQTAQAQAQELKNASERASKEL